MRGSGVRVPPSAPPFRSDIRQDGPAVPSGSVLAWDVHVGAPPWGRRGRAGRTSLLATVLCREPGLRTATSIFARALTGRWPGRDRVAWPLAARRRPDRRQGQLPLLSEPVASEMRDCRTRQPLPRWYASCLVGLTRPFPGTAISRGDTGPHRAARCAGRSGRTQAPSPALPTGPVRAGARTGPTRAAGSRSHGPPCRC